MSGVIPASGVAKNAKRAILNATASGVTAAIAAVTTSKIRVLALVLTTTAENTIKFQSASTDITPTFPFVALGGMVLPFNEHGWFETVKNEALNFSQSVATPCAIHIVYAEIN